MSGWMPVGLMGGQVVDGKAAAQELLQRQGESPFAATLHAGKGFAGGKAAVQVPVDERGAALGECAEGDGDLRLHILRKGLFAVLVAQCDPVRAFAAHPAKQGVGAARDGPHGVRDGVARRQRQALNVAFGGNLVGDGASAV